MNSTFESLLQSSCNSCEIFPDKSAYWSPNLYYERPNGTFEEVPHSGSVVYYLGRGYQQDGSQNFTPFPPGMKIVSGNKAVRAYNATGMTWGNDTYPSFPKANAINFACLAVQLGPETNNMVDVNTCVNGLRAQIHFQNCWDGVNLYKSDNSHVAYLSGIDNGVCPPGYPVLLPHLFLETNYAVSNLDNTTDGGQYVFSMGDPTGYGFHADFQNGWDMEIQTAAVANCIGDTGFGTIEECAILQANRVSEFGSNCPAMPEEIDEPVHGLIDHLPGCVRITYGPGSATAADLECAAGVPQPSIFRTVDSTPLPTMNPAIGEVFGNPHEQYVGCGNDTYGSPLRTLNAVSTVLANMTVEYCQSYCTSLGYRLSGVEYQTQCLCDIIINPSAQFYAGLNLTDGCDLTCPGNRSELCGGAAYVNVFNNTDPNFVSTNDTANSAIQLYVPVKPFDPSYIGCVSEGTTGRALNATSFETANMTIELCASHCTALNHRYYGLEYFTECYCGDGLASGSLLVDRVEDPTVSTCNVRCAGDYGQVCGGRSFLSVYENHNYTEVLVNPFVGHYLSKRCVTDPNAALRPLKAGGYNDGVNMTVESCVRFCQTHGYKYAG